MRLLKLVFRGFSLFQNDTLELDFFAADRVPKLDGVGLVQDVTLVGDTTSIYSQNAVGISGVNASGKTTTLNLIKLAIDSLNGEVMMRGFRGQATFIGRIEKRLELEAIFWHEGRFYLIQSFFVRAGQHNRSAYLPDGLVYDDETLWVLDAPRVNRAMLANPEAFKQHSSVVCRRNESGKDGRSLTESELNLLGPERSIASVVTGRSRAEVELLQKELPEATLPTPIVQAFDASVERLEWDAENEVYRLKFAGQPERIVNHNAALSILSRGTVFGVAMVNQAIEVLSCGGYLIVDEMEEGINRSLVATVIDLFASPVTNPYGAQLVFTTHYPELLDALHRKDNVYLLVRDADLRTVVVKYSDRVNRIEVKKSEVVLSELVKGTMPRYPDVRAMREYVRERVNG